MQVISDLHLHSKYSRAVSRDMELSTMASFAAKKGIELLTTGDWTHPLWLREIKNKLEESDDGIFNLKGVMGGPKFILSVEVSSIYSQGGKTRRIHSLIFAPSIETVEKINADLVKRGANLTSDGRPIVGIPAKNLLEIVLGIDKKAFMIPCHAWTPWFSLYGSMSGFDSIDECFGDLSPEIFAIETGLSSDPAMNWRIKELESRSIVSFSDAHSPAKMGREATSFELESLTFENIKKALRRKGTANRIAYTIEFYPEEGKYHFTGHRNCLISLSPDETKEKGTICPVCKRPLTVGVMQRVEDLAGNPEKYNIKENENGLRWLLDPRKIHPPYVKLVPLNEIIAETLGFLVGSQKVKSLYDELVKEFGSEFTILLKTPIPELEKKAGDKIAHSIAKVRSGDIYIKPGYDGEFGVVKINQKEAPQSDDGVSIEAPKSAESQLGLDF